MSDSPELSTVPPYVPKNLWEANGQIAFQWRIIASLLHQLIHNSSDKTQLQAHYEQRARHYANDHTTLVISQFLPDIGDVDTDEDWIDFTTGTEQGERQFVEILRQLLRK